MLREQKFIGEKNVMRLESVAVSPSGSVQGAVKELAQETGIPEEEIRDVYRISGYVIEDLEDR